MFEYLPHLVWCLLLNEFVITTIKMSQIFKVSKQIWAIVTGAALSSHRLPHRKLTATQPGRLMTLSVCDRSAFISQTYKCVGIIRFFGVLQALILLNPGSIPALFYILTCRAGEQIRFFWLYGLIC